MDSSLRELLARLGPIRAADRVPCGSPAAFVLRLPPYRDIPQGFPKTIDATLALVKRGMAMLHAKRLVEELLETRQVSVEVPMVEDPASLAADLAAAGIAAEPVEQASLADAQLPPALAR